MAKETEVKLALPADKAELVQELSLLRAGEYQGQYHLTNDYFDTPDLLLTQHKVALRIRTQGSQIIQTLKTRGTSVNGLHQRGEWEWLLTEAVLDLSKLVEAEWPNDLVVDQIGSQLMPIFKTDFYRTLWLVNKGETQIEVAFDQGHACYTTPSGLTLQDPICELELELKAGNVDDLLHIKDQLLLEMPVLTASAVTKAERGYRLYAQAQGE